MHGEPTVDGNDNAGDVRARRHAQKRDDVSHLWRLADASLCRRAICWALLYVSFFNTCAAKGVFVYQGATALTLMLSFAHSHANDRVS